MRAAILLLLAAGAASAPWRGFRAILSPMMTHADAKKSCIAQGGQLAKLATLEDLGLLQELTCHEAAHSPHDVWVGAEDSVEEGEWVWPDGSGLSVTDEIWADRQPGWNYRGTEDQGTEDCARAQKRGGPGEDPSHSDWELYDVVCDRRDSVSDIAHFDLSAFVCKINSLEVIPKPSTLNPKS
jgi:hypothetical protein